MNQLVQNWWALALRGILGIVFGLLAFFAPFRTISALMFVFGGYLLFQGIFLGVVGIRAYDKGIPRWWTLVLQGAFGILAAVLMFATPLQAAVAVVYVVAFWAIVTGVLEIVSAIRLRHEIQNEWLLIASGALSVLLGVFLVATPGTGLLAWAWILGAYALVAGILMVLLALRLRAHGQHRAGVVPT